MNKMRINTKKCKIMRITRKKSPLVGEYNIEGQPLESVDMYKDLGLFTTSNLSWNQHVDKITAKANRVLGLVKRTCRDLKDIDTMNTLYCSLVRPLLEAKLGTLILNVTLINWRLFSEELPDGSLGLMMIMILDYLS